MKLLLADTVIQVNNLYTYIEEYCKDYIYTGRRDIEFCVDIYESDIEYERNKSRQEDLKKGIKIREFDNAYLETLTVYRKICKCLLDKNIILFHGSVVSVDSVGYLFTAKSGTGKSTHTRYWCEYFKDRALMINDDKPLIEIKDDCVFVYGTPWDGKHRLSNNTKVKLKSICILNRGDTNCITKVNSSDVYSILLQQVNRPIGDIDGMHKTLNLIDKLCKRVEFYSMNCTMNIETAKVAYEGMK